MNHNKHFYEIFLPVIVLIVETETILSVADKTSIGVFDLQTRLNYLGHGTLNYRERYKGETFLVLW
jgi:hypothetical protein